MKVPLLFLLTAVLALTSCQSTGPVQTSPGSYVISRTSAAGAFANMAKVQAAVIAEAEEFARRQGGVAVQTGRELSRPPVGLPSFTYSFTVMTAEAYAKGKERAARDYAALTPAQRYALQQGELDRKAYNSRTRAMEQPRRVLHDVNVRGNVQQDVNVQGNIRHDVGGTLYLR